MTARALLEAAAKDYDRRTCKFAGCGLVECDAARDRATALRTLADRLDAEMRAASPRCVDTYDTLARLDAPLDVDPNSTQQESLGPHPVPNPPPTTPPDALSPALPKGGTR